MLIRIPLSRMRHDGGGRLPGKAELLRHRTAGSHGRWHAKPIKPLQLWVASQPRRSRCPKYRAPLSDNMY
jgi:hypothetical protein